MSDSDSFGEGGPVREGRSPAYRYDWVKNEGLLRDEGVLFGLVSDAESDAGLRYKLECIDHEARRVRSKFDRRRATLEAHLRQIDDERAEVEVELSKADEVEEQAAAERDDPDANSAVRHGLGALLALATCTFNFAIVYELLDGTVDRPIFVALGVMLAGLFGFFRPVALLLSSDTSQRPSEAHAELWKVRLVEFGLPVAAALFVTLWQWHTRPPVQSVAAFVFLVLVFLIAGRLLLSTFPILGVSIRTSRERRRQRRNRDKAEAEHERLRTRRRELRDARLRVEQELHGIPSAEEVEARRDIRKSLFSSEVSLALNTRARGFADAETIESSGHRGNGHGASLDHGFDGEEYGLDNDDLGDVVVGDGAGRVDAAEEHVVDEDPRVAPDTGGGERNTASDGLRDSDDLEMNDQGDDER